VQKFASKKEKKKKEKKTLIVEFKKRISPI
jgi:hypothetical protein